MTKFQRYAEGEDPREAVKLLAETAMQEMIEEIKSGYSSRLDEFFSFASTFYRYSSKNQQLLAAQAKARGEFPQHVASFHYWSSIGQCVAKGAKSFRVWAPIMVKDKERPGEPDAPKLQRFKLVPVFGDFQLALEDKDGNPIPRPPNFFPIFPNDQQELYGILQQAVRQLGFSFAEGETGSAGGWANSGHIQINASIDSTHKCIATVHELAHVLLHWGKDRKKFEEKIKECHAAGTAEVVARYLGIEHSFTKDYFLSWAINAPLLEAELATITSASQQIIAAINAVMGHSSEEGEGA